MAQINEFRRLTTKDVQTLLEVSPNTANKVLNDIKTDLNVPLVLYIHFKRYFKITQN